MKISDNQLLYVGSTGTIIKVINSEKKTTNCEILYSEIGEEIGSTEEFNNSQLYLFTEKEIECKSFEEARIIEDKIEALEDDERNMFIESDIIRTSNPNLSNIVILKNICYSKKRKDLIELEEKIEDIVI